MRVMTQRRTRLMGVALALELLEDRLLLAGDVEQGDNSHALLPDLIAWTDEERGYVYGWTLDEQPTATLLRLTAVVANVGTGPLELRSGQTHGDATQDVSQRIYLDDGSYVDRPAGSFVYHESHGHIHFDGFTQYNLRAVLPDNQVGDIVATSGKVSFCLTDTAPYDVTLSGTSDQGRYFSCNGFQGISPGWADMYHEGLPDQWIDVTGVPTGQYWLEINTDADSLIAESNEANNISRILIDYVKSDPLSKDSFEPNDSRLNPNAFGTATTRRIDGLRIQAPGNEHLFLWTAPETGVLTVEIESDYQQGDLNLLVYREAPFEEIGLSLGTSDIEKVVVPVVRNSVYLIRVIGKGNAISPAYSLSLSLGADSGTGQADALEPNDTRSRATSLGPGDITIPDLTIHSAVDDDWFRWIAPTSGPVDVSVSFLHASGNVDLFVYEWLSSPRRAALLGSSTGTSDDELVSVMVEAGQTYFIKVIGHEFQTSPSYTLHIYGPEQELLLAGDANRDHRFDHLDIVQVLQAGKYLTGKPATFEEGDWNGDGQFDSADLVLALQAGHYGDKAESSTKALAAAADPAFAQETSEAGT